MKGQGGAGRIGAATALNESEGTSMCEENHPAPGGELDRRPPGTPPERIVPIEVTENLRARFQMKVSPGLPEGECWEWQGAKTRMGLGVIKAAGGRRAPLVYAHRVAWAIHHGPIPTGMVVRQRCGNKACVNPVHLETDTCRGQIRKPSRPPKQPRQKLVSDETAKQAKAAAATGKSYRSIAKSLGITQKAVNTLAPRGPQDRRWQSAKVAPIVLSMVAEGVSRRTIAAAVGVSHSTVNNIVKWHREGRLSPHDAGGSKTTPPPVVTSFWPIPRASLLDFGVLAGALPSGGGPPPSPVA